MGAEALFALSALSAAGSVYQGRKQTQQLKKADKAQGRIADLQRNEALRERVRRARALRADIIQSGENQGVGGSSGVLGGGASVVSQTFGGAGYLNRIGEQANIASSANQSAANAASTASIFNTVGSLSQTLLADFGGTESIFRK